MATALAASITCSTSPCVTSLSRTPTTPWELRLRTWLPAMPANTEWISQPAMSSASSTARWMDCTVDSMLTTTPFFSPREGCEPRPSSSIEPSSPTSPTSATTLEVPMSSPTIRFLSARLSIVATVAAGGAGGSAAPADGKAVCVTHIHVGDVLGALGDELQRGVHEFLEALVHLAPSEAHGDAVGQIEFPGAACIQAHRGEAQARLRQAPLRGQIALRHERLLALGAGELRELGRNVALVGVEQLATAVEEPAPAPAPPAGPPADQHGQAPRVKLVSSTRHTSSSKSTSMARAAIGTRLWLVMPGTVLISSSSGLPAASIMKSARPQPEAPAASNAASARLARCSSALLERPDGQK